MISPSQAWFQPQLEELPVEQPREADVVREVLEPGRLALARGSVLGEVATGALGSVLA